MITIRHHPNLLNRTLSDLLDDPYLFIWIKYVEPHIVRTDDCFLWQGFVNKHYNSDKVLVREYPQFNLPEWDRERSKLVRTNRVGVRRLVADIFWEGLDKHTVVAVVCKQDRCVNPEHFRLLRRGEIL
ncbi:MAG: hypothetical protein V3W37_08935 [Candidatus Binatia bacterium]